MLDIKTFKSALEQLEEERKIPKEKILDAIEQAMAAAYKKDYGKKGQIIRAKFDLDTGKTDFFQVKIVVDESIVKMEIPTEEERGKERQETRRPDGRYCRLAAFSLGLRIRRGDERARRLRCHRHQPALGSSSNIRKGIFPTICRHNSKKEFANRRLGETKERLDER